MSFSNDFCCMICNLKLSKICIYCAECPADPDGGAEAAKSRLRNYLCLECFSHGVEDTRHKRTHAYKVVNLEAIVTFDGWTAHDEMRLINLVEESKYNLNELIGKLNAAKRGDAESKSSSSRQLGVPLSSTGVVRHYEKWFKLMGKAPVSDRELFYKRALLRTTGVSLLNEAASNDLLSSSAANTSNGGALWNTYPARPQLLSAHFRLMNGYRPARADFETEFEDKHESRYISEMDVDKWTGVCLDPEPDTDTDDVEVEEAGDDELTSDSDIESQLKVQVLRSYGELVRERYERKTLIRKFGMLNELALSSTYYQSQAANVNVALSLINNRQYQHEASALLPSRYLGSLSASFDAEARENFFHLKNNQFTNWTQMLRIPSKLQRLFASSDELTKFNEIVCYHHQVRKRLDELREYRANGLASLKHIGTYVNMKLKRLNRQPPSVHLSSLLTTITNRCYHDDSAKTKQLQQQANKEQCREWFKRFVILERNLMGLDTASTATGVTPAATASATSPAPSLASPHTVRALKNQQNPLKIENYPDVEKLDEDEKELCRVARIRPTVYLRVKAILLLENTKAGFCNYSRARKIAGIDVNKTRVIHTFMVNHNHIKGQQSSDD